MVEILPFFFEDHKLIYACENLGSREVVTAGTQSTSCYGLLLYQPYAEPRPNLGYAVRLLMTSRYASMLSKFTPVRNFAPCSHRE